MFPSRAADPVRVALPVPNRDFDPTEVAVSWDVLRGAGIDVVFATPDGGRASGDEIMIDGRGLSVFGRLLRANADARAAYALLVRAPAFAAPLAYADLRVADFDGLLLPGGHRARGMRAYLESTVLQRFVGDFFDSGKPVAAICHGVVLAARSRSGISGASVLRGRKTTALTWAFERAGWRLGCIGRFWDRAHVRRRVARSFKTVALALRAPCASPEET